MKKWIAVLCVFVLLGFGALFVFREQLDVVAAGAVSTFEAVLEALPAVETSDVYKIESPDHAVRMSWKRSEQGEVFFSIDAQSFLNAGLSMDQSPYPIEDGRMIVSSGWSVGLETPELLMQSVAEQQRERIGFHAAHGHYGLSFSGGNALEWAPDFANSEKDIVFVLNPGQLVSAGVDIEQVEGWVYTTIPMMENGKMIEVYKLVKPFDLV